MKISDYSYQITAWPMQYNKPWGGSRSHDLTVYDIWDSNKYHRISIHNNNIYICHIDFDFRANTTLIQLRMVDNSSWNKFNFKSVLINPKINLLEILKREQLYPSLAEDLERACS